MSTAPTTSTNSPTTASTKKAPAAPGLLGRLVVRLLLVGAPAWLAARLLRAVSVRPTWNAQYEALRRIERALGPAPNAAISQGQIDLVESLLLAQATTTPPKSGPLKRALTSPFLVFPAGAAAGVLLMLVARSPSAHEAPAWQERGGGEAPHVGVRARCVDAGAHRVVGQAEAGPRMLDDRLACPHGDLLSVSLTNLEAQPYYVFVVGVSASGALRFISPFDEVSNSREATPGGVDQPLDVLADTASLPANDDVTLFTLFSKTPLAGAEVARRVRDARAHGVSVHALARLPFDAYTARIELQQTP